LTRDSGKSTDWIPRYSENWIEHLGAGRPVYVCRNDKALELSPEEIIAEFPNLTREQIAACLDYARDLAEFEVTA
jgi:uncharacterized protein DUF433